MNSRIINLCYVSMSLVLCCNQVHMVIRSHILCCIVSGRSSATAKTIRHFLYILVSKIPFLIFSSFTLINFLYSSSINYGAHLSFFFIFSFTFSPLSPSIRPHHLSLPPRSTPTTPREKLPLLSPTGGRGRAARRRLSTGASPSLRVAVAATGRVRAAVREAGSRDGAGGRPRRSEDDLFSTSSASKLAGAPPPRSPASGAAAEARATAPQRVLSTGRRGRPQCGLLEVVRRRPPTNQIAAGGRRGGHRGRSLVGEISPALLADLLRAIKSGLKDKAGAPPHALSLLRRRWQRPAEVASSGGALTCGFPDPRGRTSSCSRAQRGRRDGRGWNRGAGWTTATGRRRPWSSGAGPPPLSSPFPSSGGAGRARAPGRRVPELPYVRGRHPGTAAAIFPGSVSCRMGTGCVSRTQCS